MTKKRSKSLFVLFSILLVICLVACFVNFTYPFVVNGNYYSYSNFVDNLKFGEDVSSSLRIVYRSEQKEYESSVNYDELRQSTMDDLKEIVSAEGYKDVYIAEYGNDGIVIHIGNLLTIEDKETIKGLIGKPASISFSTTDGEFAGPKHIASVKPIQRNDPTTGEISYIVQVQFKEEYIDMIKEASSGKDVSIKFGDSTFANLEYGGGAIENGLIELYSSSFESMLDATTCANQIKTGMLDLPLEQISCEYISANYGEFSTMLLSIAMVVLVLGIFAFLIIKYRQIGLVACFNLLFFITIGLFFLQSIPLVHINLAGIIAMLVSLILAVDSLIMVFEKTKEHYNNGMQLFIAFREAQKESLFKTLFLNTVLLITGFICLFMPVSAISSFGWVMLVLSLVSTFTSLVLMRLFIKMYLALNNEKGSKCNFHKGGKDA